jgi:hypothetical protein
MLCVFSVSSVNGITMDISALVGQLRDAMDVEFVTTVLEPLLKQYMR